MTARPQSGPDFLGIGTQKGGTTFLHDLLRQHPGCHLPDRKEIHFFSTEYHHGEGWYRDQFLKAEPGQQTGEITPFYMFHPQAAQRIEAFDPDLRLIALLRHPVDRAISHYHHAKQRGFEPLSLLEAIQAEPERMSSGDPWSLQKHSYVSRSRYSVQLERFAHFQQNGQLLLLKSEDLFANPRVCMVKVETFLGLSHQPIEKVIPASNKGNYSVLSEKENERRLLENLLRTEIQKLEQQFSVRWAEQLLQTPKKQ